jgi:hypothetical protein
VIAIRNSGVTAVSDPFAYALEEAEQARRAADNAADHVQGRLLEDGLRYASRRIGMRPITFVLVGLGVGLLLGVFLSDRTGPKST